MNTRREMPLLAGVAGIIRFFEELVNLISGPLLTLGLGLALVDLLTDGHLLTAVPLLLYVWAITQAIGVDAQLVASWDRARIALREHRYWSLFGLLVLGLILAYVAWVASQVFALQQSEGLSTTAALTRLGMDSASWLIQRTALSVALVALAGWTRYHAPAANVALSAAEERERLEADLMLEPLRAQKRAMQARGLRSVAAAAMGKETPAIVEATPAPSGEATGPSGDIPAAQFTPWELMPDEFKTPPDHPPTGGGTPTKKRGVRKSRKRGAKVVRLRNPSVEEKARVAWVRGMSIPALQEAAGISRPTAQKYHAKFSAEDAATAAANTSAEQVERAVQ